MVAKLLPDPAHMVPVAGEAEGIKVSERAKSAAYRRPPEIKVCCADVERGAASGTPAALSLKDGPGGLMRNICVSDGCIVGILRAPGSHVERLYFYQIYLAVRVPRHRFEFSRDSPLISGERREKPNSSELEILVVCSTRSLETTSRW